MHPKPVKALHRARRDDIGDLVTRRPLPGTGVDQIDPFLLLNHHGPQTYPPRNDGLPFGPHPHRGFETVTFIVEGELMHSDSTGQPSVIGAGGVQWMTAGRGVVHAEQSPEAFRRDGGALEILQLWINLPSRLKMIAPRYVGLQRSDIPTVPTADDRGKVRLVAGELNGMHGAFDSITGVFMSVVELPADAGVQLAALAGRSVLLYVIRGSIGCGPHGAREHTLVEFDREGDAVDVTATTAALLLLGHADPIGEPVVAHGPFVMNTRDEIVTAIRDYEAGTFTSPANERRAPGPGDDHT
jgi:redox-sensitive bicupin YhaK (pirin superfamily)